MKIILKWGILSLITIAAVFLLSNISKAFILEAPDLLRINLSSESTNEEVVSQLPGSTIVDASRHIFSVPYGRVDDYGKLAINLPGVFLPRTVPVEKPEISFRYYLFSLKDLLHDYSHGELGLIRTGNYVIQVKSIVTETIIRTCTYFIPGLITGVLLSVLLSLLASIRSAIGRLLDSVHAVLSGLPDFLLIILIQLMSIYLTRLTGRNVILVAHYGNNIPFTIPFLAISLIPGVLIYGTLRLAIEREMTQDYITTALAKGLSQREVIFRHVIRNIMEDLLMVLPKATTLALASMAVAEAMCDILGLGGYIVSSRVQNISATPIFCIVLVILAILFHITYALLSKLFVVQIKESA
ncbi:ABC transporter permease subunit [Paenibacillus qinlingensis]|uniref:ABC transporter permease subunit n=1 Tax=Paenibacillus qinlingensis TaxID=1837343 RepID=UPI00156675D0|nr:ABC transporter permease subunit [Paenibacillus qinlingensis]NQX60634.1 ABC transporter permease subunit [Paenibacillus qinlingensis]